MRKGSCKKRKLNNNGMTLIEILIAMVILTVVLVPMMYSFVRVAFFNIRGRDLQQATVMAQTVMENCKAYPMDDIDTMVTQHNFYSGGGSPDGTYYANKPLPSAAPNTPTEYFMTNIESENKKYDIYLKLTPYMNADGSAAYVNSIMSVENMNPTLDAIFIEGSTLDANSKTLSQVGKDAYSDNDPTTTNDVISLISAGIQEHYKNEVGEEFFNEQMADSSVDFYKESVIESSFYGGDTSNPNHGNLTVRRQMVLNMIKDATTGVETAQLMCTYYFELKDNKYTYTAKADASDTTGTTYEWDGWGMAGSAIDADGDGTREVTEYTSFMVYDNSATNDATNHPTKLEKAYLFYYPIYNNATYNVPPTLTGADGDIFIVNNALGREVDVYLLKQKNPAIANENHLSTAETTYGANVSATVASNQVNLYHNLNVNIAGIVNSVGTSTINFATPSTVSTDYIEKDDKKLMYNIEVQIYKAGSYDATNKAMTGTPVLTLNGTKVDW